MNYQEKYQDYLTAAGDQPVLPFEAWLDEVGNELRKQLNTLTSIKPMRFKHDVTEIMEKCFDLQNEGKATVFLNLSGHVQQLNIRIFVPAWQEGTDAKFDESFYDSTPEANAENKARILEKLNSI